MEKNMKTKLSPRFMLSLIIFSFMGQVAWVVENMYFNVFIYKMFAARPEDITNMVAFSAITATVTTVLMGALSDKIGKRRLFISLGYVLWGISIFAFVLVREDILSALAGSYVSAATLGISLTVILDCVMTFFGSTANDAAFNAWLTDSLESGNRGKAEGINAMMPLVSILAVFGGFMFFDLDKRESWSAIFAIIGALTLITGVLGFFIIKEPPINKSQEHYFKNVVFGFLPKTVKSFPRLYVVLCAFIIFNISIQIFMPYLIIYYEVTLQMENYVLVMAPAIVLASVFTALWGRVYDKKGFRFSGLMALCLLSAGYVMLFFFKNTALVFVGSLLMMCGYLAGMAVFGAIIRDNIPSKYSGSLQGARIFAQVLLPGVIGPYIAQLVLKNAELFVNSDGTTSFIPSRNIFLAALIVAALVVPFFMIIKEKKNENSDS